MSRVGKQPIPVPSGAKVEFSGQSVKVTGPKGSLSRDLHPDITATLEGSEIVVTRPNDVKRVRALHGLTRALLNNMVLGVTEGFRKELNVIGVGFRVEMKGKHLIVYVGYSHPIVVTPPDGVTLSCEPKENKIFVDGIDKEVVGNVAAKIRDIRPPEPYKGKGIRYAGEHVRSKAGKAAG